MLPCINNYSPLIQSSDEIFQGPTCIQSRRRRLLLVQLVLLLAPLFPEASQNFCYYFGYYGYYSYYYNFYQTKLF